MHTLKCEEQENFSPGACGGMVLPVRWCAVSLELLRAALRLSYTIENEERYCVFVLKP